MTQHVPILTRMGDRFSTFDISNGLQSIIPTLLTSGVLVSAVGGWVAHCWLVS